MPPPEYQLMPAGPFSLLTGPYYEHATVAAYTLVIAITDRHLNRHGLVHNGMLMSLADNAHTGAAERQNGGVMVSTADLQCDFTGKAGRGWLEARAWVNRKSRALIFTSAEIRAGGELIVSSTAICKIRGAK